MARESRQRAVGRSATEDTPDVVVGQLGEVVVHVADVDAHCERARRFGARIVDLPSDMPFGERQYTVVDLAGHRWTFSQHVADVSPEEWGAVSAGPPVKLTR